MIAPFDIFKDKDGSLLWCGTAATLEEAREKVRVLAAAEKADYVIFSQKTGNRLVIQPEGDKPTPRKTDPHKPRMGYPND